MILQEDVLQYEQDGQNIHQRRNLLALTGNQVQDHIGNDTQANTLRNAVEQGHCQNGQVSRDGLSQLVVIELQLGDAAEHQEADHDQRRRGCEGRNGGEDGGEEHSDQEQQAGDHSSQTGTAAHSSTGSGLDKGGNGGSTQNSTGSGTDGVSQQSGLNTGQTTIVIQHVSLGGNANQSAQSIENVNEQESEDHNDELQRLDNAEVNIKALTESLAQLGEVGDREGGIQAVVAQLGIGDIYANQLAEHTQDPSSHDTDEDGALDLLDMQDSGDQQTNDAENGADAGAVEVLGEVDQLNQSRTVNTQTGILQADESDEQTDTDGNTALQAQRNGIENGFTDIGQRQDDEDNTFNEDSQQADLPGVAHTQANSIGHVSVQTHACRQRKGQVCHQSHTGGTNEGSQSGCHQNSGGIHTGSGQDAGVNSEDVSHSHEGGDTSHNFGLDIRLVLRQLKDFFEHNDLPFFFLRLAPSHNVNKRTHDLLLHYVNQQNHFHFNIL